MANLSDYQGVNFLDNITLGTYYENFTDLGTGLSGSVTLDLNDGNTFVGSFSGSTTFTISNVPGSGLVIAITLYLTDTSGTPSYTWPSGTLWPGGTEPSWTANGTDIVSLTTRDNGTTWYGLPAALDI